MTDAKATSSYLILNPAAGSAAPLVSILTRAARQRGIRVRVLEPGEDARHAALEAAEDGADSLAFGEDDGEPALHRLIRDKKARLEEDEARRVFYVAPTRARDRLILTCTGLTERLCGLTLLQPGLEVAGIPVSPVPFDPQDAKPPELPSPLPAEPAGLLLAPAL